MSIRDKIKKGLETGAIISDRFNIKFGKDYVAGMLHADNKEELIDKIENFICRCDTELFLKFVENIE